MSFFSPTHVESDPRFPSGKWVGFFTDKRLPGKHRMEMVLTFANSTITGTGRDRVGAFSIDGAYQLGDGLCVWVKQYKGKHTVGYRGYAEGKGIWGKWELTFQGQTATGGFHIWPEGIADPTTPRLEEEAEVPIEVPDDDRVPVVV